MNNYLKFTCTVVLLFIMAAWAGAQDVSSQKARREKLEREIAIIDNQLAQNATKSSAMLSNLSLIRKKISNRKELVNQSDRTIKTYADRIYLTQKKINRMQARVDTLTSHYSRLVLSAYKNRDARIWYMYMLASEDLGQAFRRYSYFRNLSSQMNDEAKKIREAQDELAAQRDSLSALKRDAETVKKDRVVELNRLKKGEKEADSVVKKLKNNRKTYQKQLNEKKKEVLALNREIERIVAAAMKSGKSTSKGGKKTEIDHKLAAEFAKNKGKLPWPADGPVVGRFGKHFHPVYKNLELPPNNGVDIALGKGTQVNAVFGGTVSQVLVMPGYNQCVLVQHGNYFTFYCKLKSVDVKAGDKVKIGQTIGRVDTINGDTQLHFEVWQGTKPQNPEVWLK